MALSDILSKFNDIIYRPRTLQLNIPHDITDSLSDPARDFLDIAFGSKALSVYDLTSDTWKEDPLAIEHFFHCDEDTRTEILAFLTFFVHEYTHRIDFLISPFGLYYYTNTLREYHLLQEFFPRILDDPRTVDHVRFLVAFRENTHEVLMDSGVKAIWKDLESIIHNFYAWGDVSDISPIGRYIKEGWSDEILDASDPFGVGIAMEPITVLGFFHTFRVPGGDKFWYLRPLTIFETKAIVNSLLFILHLFGETGVNECLRYYEKIYLQRKHELSTDYFFLLDLGAHIYGYIDFYSLLKQGDLLRVRSTLLILSSICWYALQATIPLKGEKIQSSNPIIRFWICFNFMYAIIRRNIQVHFTSLAEALLILDNWEHTKSFYQKPVNEVVPDCLRVVDHMIQMNKKYTWNPDIKKHFHHIFTLMRPHFAERDVTYVSLMGMPDHGNPFFGCTTKTDWELTYDDYQIPQAVSEWFSMRTDLLFNLLKPAEEVIKRLDKHYMAFLIPYQCECEQGITSLWASRFAEQFDITCAFCGQKKTLYRADMMLIAAPNAKD